MGSGHIFLHIRVVLAIVLGLSITKLLNGIALLIERRDLWSPVHVSWVLWALISVVTFWWWEFGLSRVPTWTFSSYLFVIIYGSLYFVLSALLFPDEAEKYGGYEDYLVERRHWFFGLIVLITLMDMIDTSLKGAARWHMLGIAYPIKTGAMLVIAGTGMILINKRAHLVLALIALFYLTAYYTIEYFNATI